MRIVFFGTPEAAVPSLEAFAADPGTDVVAVVTNPDRPSGRGYKLTPPPVKVAAEAHGLPVWQPEKPREILDHLLALRLDACAVVAYGALLPQDVLDAGGRGFVNLHFSLLPAWRGAAPVQHAVMHGDRTGGVTCFVLDKGMDTGDVLLAEPTEIGPDETAGELMARMAVLGAPVLVRAVKGLVDGSIPPRLQDHAQATLAPKIANEDAAVDWTRPAAAVHNLVRGLNPVPGAFTLLDGERLKIHRTRLADGDGAPGEVVRIDADGPVVAAGDGAVLLTEVQPAGKARMTGAAFGNGYRPQGKRLGKRLGQ